MLWLLSFLIGLIQWIQNLLVFNSSIPGLLFLSLMVRMWLVENGFIKLRGIEMVILLGIRQGWWPMVTFNNTVWIMQRHLVLLSNLPLSELFLP